MWETWVRSLAQEDLLEKGMATHSSVIAHPHPTRKGLNRTFSGEGNGNPLQYSCLENPMDGGAWEAAVHGVAKSRTQLSDLTFTFTWILREMYGDIHRYVLT